MKGYDEPYGPGMDAWEASCLNASRVLHLVRAARIRQLEDEVAELKLRIKELENNSAEQVC